MRLTESLVSLKLSEMTLRIVLIWVSIDTGEFGDLNTQYLRRHMHASDLTLRGWAREEQVS